MILNKIQIKHFHSPRNTSANRNIVLDSLFDVWSLPQDHNCLENRFPVLMCPELLELLERGLIK